MTAAAYEGKDDYIFVSYSHEDSKMVLPIIESLRHAGYRVWYDAGIKPGFDWTEYIADHVASCRCMLALITTSSVNSPHCKRELYYAFSQNKDMLLVYLEDTQLTPGMEMYYDLFQAMKRSSYPSQEEFIASLLKADILKPCLFKDAARRRNARHQAVEDLSRMAEALLGRYDVEIDSFQPILLALRVLPDDEKDKESEWLVGRLMERVNWLEYERNKSIRGDSESRVSEKGHDIGKSSGIEASRGKDSGSSALTSTAGLGDSSLPDSVHPRVFISYSWTSDKYRQEVIELAVSLMRNGVEVVIDDWDLEPGQDKFEFMERCVNDGTIQKVLMLCDKVYADKANSRRGGVGNETSIITPEVYRSAEQTKFIPVLMERGADGAEYLPAYLSSRMYIDLSDRAHRKQYRDLLRSIYGVPRRPKSELGTRPSWIDDFELGHEEKPQEVETKRTESATPAAEEIDPADSLGPKDFTEPVKRNRFSSISIEQETSYKPKRRDAQPETLYRLAVKHIIDDEIDLASKILESWASVHAPSALLLAHLYHSRTTSGPLDEYHARHLWDEVESTIPSKRWKQIGVDYDNKKSYSEALAYFLACGERNGDSDSLFKASQMWLKKGCLKQALIALQLSSNIGSEKARRFHRQLSYYSEDEVRRHAYIDEAPVE